ncbi:gluconokinase [bacterium]|nr:gluconokinase [bacterium]
MIVVVMGVAGCGKSTVGRMLADRLGLPFHDADAFHPSANIAKMASGVPLTDADRWPWLDAMAAEMPRWERLGGAVLACSALREVYRERLRTGSPQCRFVYLRGDRSLLEQRLAERPGHFMKPGMLDSQLATLEEPADAIVADVALSPEEICQRVTNQLMGASSL